MKIQLRFFSVLRQRFHTAEKVIDIQGSKSVRDIFLGLFDDQETAKRFLPAVRFAINWEYVAPETLVGGGDELAFIPPVSGG
jgi:molybdopterin synthase sulfur carrier subunit